MQHTFTIHGLQNPNSTETLKHAITNVDGVQHVETSYTTSKIHVQYDEPADTTTITNVIRDAGFTLDYDEQHNRNMTIASLLLSIPILTWTYTQSSFYEPTGVPYYLFTLTTILLAWTGRQFFINTWHALTNTTLNADVLISTALTTTYIYSVIATFIYPNQPTFYATIALVNTIILFGRYIRQKSTAHTTKALDTLRNRQPRTATVKRDDTTEELTVENVQQGDTVVIKPGTHAPVDGTVTDGNAKTQPPFTNATTKKTLNDTITAGTYVTQGTLHVETTAVGNDTILDKVINKAEHATHHQPSSHKTGTSTATYLTPTILLLAIATCITWYTLGQTLPFALTTAASVLVITTPTYFKHATPSPVATGTSRAANEGIVVTKGTTFEQLNNIDTIILDKTTTVTQDDPRVTDIAVTDPYDPDVLLKYAAIATKQTDHSLASPIMDKALDAGLDVPDPQQRETYENGIQATTLRKQIHIGDKTFADKHANLAPIQQYINDYELEGKTVLAVIVNDEAAGVIAIQDPIRDGVEQAVHAMHRAGLNVTMITHDNERVANAIGDKINTDQVKANVSPNLRTSTVEAIQGSTAMVGDGIHDPSALDAATIGIAFGTNNNITNNAGDVLLVNEDLLDVVRVIIGGRSVQQTITQNLYLATTYTIGAIPVAAGVLYPLVTWSPHPAVATGAMAVINTAVVLNALRVKIPKIALN